MFMSIDNSVSVCANCLEVVFVSEEKTHGCGDN